MSGQKRILLLILIMTIVALVVGGISIALLYRAAFREEQARLVETAQSQARLIEAIARFDALHSRDYPAGAAAATLSQIRDAHENYIGFGQTGEFTLARREGDLMVFLLRHRHYDTDLPQPVPFNSELAEPMRRSLLGHSGTVVGLDYRGETVLAAYEPVAELDLGIVAKIDLAEILAPFVRAGIMAGAVAVAAVILGALLFIRITDPLLKHLQENEERLRRFMEAATEAFFLFDPELNYIMVNQTGMRLFPTGTRPEDVIGRNMLDLVPDTKKTGRYDQYRKVIETGEPFLADDVVPHPKFGELYLTMRAFKVGDGLGITVADVTERKQAEEALRESEEKYRTLFERESDGIFIYDPDTTNIFDANETTSKMYGYDKDELIGMSCLKFSVEVEESASSIDRIREAGEVNVPIRYHRKKDGTVFPVDVSGYAITLGGKNVMFAVSKDITERVQAEEQIKASLKEKEVLMQELFHRTKNNMYVISSMLAMQALRSPDEQTRRILQDMDNRIQAMSLVHEQLYQAQDLSHIDLTGYIADLAALVMGNYPATINRIDLIMDMENISVLIDTAIPCGQVLNELLANALQHAFPGERAGEIRLGLRRVEENVILLHFADNGVGLPPGFDPRQSDTLGLQTIFRVAEHQLQAEVTVDMDNGLAWHIRFRDDLYRVRV